LIHTSTPEYRNNKENTKEAPDRIVAIDPGWNTLMTYYSPSGEWGEICPGIKEKIKKYRDEINKLKTKGKDNAIQKRIKKITNTIDDLHWKICHWLLSKFRKIIISKLYVARCSKEGKQTQADLRLCEFVKRLTHKSIEYKNSEIHVGREHHTSRACTKCLSLNTVKDTTVRCKDCRHKIHRDLNGARNMFLKHCF
jgi:transposase